MLAGGLCASGDVNIITLYKNKGDMSDTGWGISLLSIISKFIARVLLTRLQKLAEHMHPESHCGFPAEQLTIDMVFSVQMQRASNSSALRLHRPNQGFWPGQQGQALQTAAKDQLPTDSPE